MLKLDEAIGASHLAMFGKGKGRCERKKKEKREKK